MSPRHAQRRGRHSAAKGEKSRVAPATPQTVSPEASWDYQQSTPGEVQEVIVTPAAPETVLPTNALDFYEAAAALTSTGQVEHGFIGYEDSPAQLYFDAPMATHVDPTTGVQQELLGVIGRVYSTVEAPGQDDMITSYTASKAVVHVKVPVYGSYHSFLTLTGIPADSGQAPDGRATWRPKSVLSNGEACKQEVETSPDEKSAINIKYDPVDPQQAWEYPPHIELSTAEGTATILHANRAYTPANHVDTLGALWTASPADLQGYVAGQYNQHQ